MAPNRTAPIKALPVLLKTVTDKGELLEADLAAAGVPSTDRELLARASGAQARQNRVAAAAGLRHHARRLKRARDEAKAETNEQASQPAGRGNRQTGGKPHGRTTQLSACVLLWDRLLAAE